MLFKLQHGLVDIGDCAILRPGDQRTWSEGYLPATLSVYKCSFFQKKRSKIGTDYQQGYTLNEFKAA